MATQWREANQADRETYNGAEDFADGCNWWVNWEIYIDGQPGNGVADAEGVAFYCPDYSDNGYLWQYRKTMPDSRGWVLALERLYGNHLTEDLLLGFGLTQERA